MYTYLEKETEVRMNEEYMCMFHTKKIVEESEEYESSRFPSLLSPVSRARVRRAKSQSH